MPSFVAIMLFQCNTSFFLVTFSSLLSIKISSCVAVAVCGSFQEVSSAVVIIMLFPWCALVLARD